MVGKKKFKHNKNIRDSSIVWLNEKWLFDLIFPYMYSANENSGWNVDVDASEDMQLTQYKKKGFYNYHKDGAGFNLHNKPYSKNLHNKTRKLSMTMLLNDDFDGGEFQFYNQPAFEMQKGDIIFFPSFELHRVLPINEGVRHSLVSLVCWT